MNHYSDKKENYLIRDQSKIYYYQIGLRDAPVILLLHGGFGSAEDFTSIMEYLVSRFTVIGIDSRGQGRSTLGDDGLSYQLMQHDVEAILHQLGISSLSIIGFSDGGILAYRLAAFSDLDIRCLITIGSRWHVSQTDGFKDFLETLTGTIWKQMFPEKYEQYQFLNPEPDYDRLTSIYTKMCLDLSEKGHPNEAIANIKCPILAIRGELDPVVTDRDLKELAEILQQMKVYTLSGAGHSAHIERPQIFLEHVNKFFDSQLLINL